MPWKLAGAWSQGPEADVRRRRGLLGLGLERSNRRRCRRSLSMMTKTIRRCGGVLALASIAGAFGGTWSLTAQERPGRGDSEISGGACAVVAVVKARRGKEAELRAATLPLVAL